MTFVLNNIFHNKYICIHMYDFIFLLFPDNAIGFSIIDYISHPRLYLTGQYSKLLELLRNMN